MDELEPVTVMRGNFGPFAGVRLGRVAVYDWEIPQPHVVRPGLSRIQRTFLMLDEGLQLQQPIVFSEPQAGWWYIDLVKFEESGAHIRSWDQYLDVIVGPPGHPYRVLDLDEFGDAIESGALSMVDALTGMRRFQRFLDTHLNRRSEPIIEWPDFPPAAIRPLFDVAIPPASPNS